LDLELRYIHINTWLATINGLSVEEHLGRTIGEVLPEVAASVEPLLRQVIETGEPIVDGMVEVGSSAQAGAERMFQHSYLPVRSDDGAMIGVTCVVREITSRKQTEEALRESEQQLRLITENLPAFIAYVDSTQHYRFANLAYARMFDHSVNDIVGKSVEAVVGRALYPSIAERIKTVLSGKNVDFERWLPLPDRQETCAHVRYVPHFNMDSQVRGFFVLITDITKRKRAESLLQKREYELAHAVRLNSMGEMVAEITHEISQPLFAISNFAKACTTCLENGTGDTMETIGWIRRIDDIATMASAILNRAKNYLTDKEFARSTFDLNDVLNESVELLGSDTRRRHVNVQLVCSKSRLDVSAGRVQIQQVFVNLIRNDCEAMEDVSEVDRHVTIHTSCKDDIVEVIVEDNGPGIAPDSANKLFSTFFTTKKNGMGMGLAVCRSIIEDHGGTIDSVPTTGHGAAFRFTLPLVLDGVRDES
jgi:PAS domain S-box-containing protein